MHKSSYLEMKKNIDKYFEDKKSENLIVGDLGSLNINGSYKDLLPPNWTYMGIDQAPGKGVDVIMEEEYVIPLEDNSIDILLSGQCLEHVKNPFKLMTEATRILKPNHLALIVAPFIFIEHGYPRDCFRFLPDGMRAIFEECGLEVIDAYRSLAHQRKHLQQEDCWGIGRKL